MWMNWKILTHGKRLGIQISGADHKEKEKIPPESGRKEGHQTCAQPQLSGVRFPLLLPLSSHTLTVRSIWSNYSNQHPFLFTLATCLLSP